MPGVSTGLNADWKVKIAELCPGGSTIQEIASSSTPVLMSAPARRRAVMGNVWSNVKIATRKKSSRCGVPSA
jgi:hypothetical protein